METTTNLDFFTANKILRVWDAMSMIELAYPKCLGTAFPEIERGALRLIYRLPSRESSQKFQRFSTTVSDLIYGSLLPERSRYREDIAYNIYIEFLSLNVPALRAVEECIPTMRQNDLSFSQMFLQNIKDWLTEVGRRLHDPKVPPV